MLMSAFFGTARRQPAGGPAARLFRPHFEMCERIAVGVGGIGTRSAASRRFRRLRRVVAWLLSCFVHSSDWWVPFTLMQFGANVSWKIS
jgi:hypothetical protein